jgi:hypothetical protein
LFDSILRTDSSFSVVFTVFYLLSLVELQQETVCFFLISVGVLIMKSACFGLRGLNSFRLCCYTPLLGLGSSY